MDEAVRAEYESILAEVVVERGLLVGVGREDSEFSWQDYDNYNDNPHLSGCRVAEHGRPVEAEWREFVGTFAEQPYESHHGVDLPGVRCACGELAGRTLRLELPVQDLAEEVFTKLYKRTH